MKKLIIGIDPDVDKNGVAVLDTFTKAVEVHSMILPELTELLKRQVYRKDDVTVVVEAGFMITHNWHLKTDDGRRMAAAKGVNQGRNGQVGRIIVQFCEYYELEVVKQYPLTKCWKGKDGKITHEEICQFVPDFPSRSNQEERDAALLAWNYANFPIRIKKS